MSDTKHSTEFDVIARYFRPLAKSEPGALNLADDAAVLDIPKDMQIVVTTDALVAGVHFLETLSPRGTAQKVAGVNLSDLAAMGAQPKWAFLAAQFSPHTSEEWIADFAHGLGDALRDAGAVLTGGDTVATPGPLAFTLTLIGFVAKGCALTRSGAKQGDDLYVTGTIGDGALGLQCLTGTLPMKAYLADRYARPRPRNAFALKLAQAGLANACVDISDGLAADVRHICEASNVNATIEAARVPLSDAAKDLIEHDASLMTNVLSGGDDYELAFTASPDDSAAIKALAQETSLAVTCIGHIEKGNGKSIVRVLDHDACVMDLGVGGYVHR